MSKRATWDRKMKKTSLNFATRWSGAFIQAALDKRKITRVFIIDPNKAGLFEVIYKKPEFQPQFRRCIFRKPLWGTN